MGTLSHHQAKARDFLHRADRAISTHDPATHDPAEAAASLRRAASHATTALAVHQGWKHKSQRQLETVLHANIVGETLSRSHLKTFRQAHTLSQQMPTTPAHLSPSYHASNPLMVSTPNPSHTRSRRGRQTTPQNPLMVNLSNHEPQIPPNQIIL